MWAVSIVLNVNSIFHPALLQTTSVILWEGSFSNGKSSVNNCLLMEQGGDCWKHSCEQDEEYAGEIDEKRIKIGVDLPSLKI